MTRVAVIASRIRVEEKLLLAALEAAGADVTLVNDDQLVFSAAGGGTAPPAADVVLERSLSAARDHALRLLRSAGIPTVNRYETAATCWDDFLTTAALADAGVPQPRTGSRSPRVRFAAIEELGYPVVLKPVVGSWGGCWRASTTVTQPRRSWSIRKSWARTCTASSTSRNTWPSRAATSARFVVGDETICAIYRASSHWITNTARR